MADSDDLAHASTGKRHRPPILGNCRCPVVGSLYNGGDGFTEEAPMLKIGVTAALVCLAIAPVQAGQKYRAMAMAGVPACVAVQEIPPILYPAPDWEPFFRRHLYVAPVVT